MFVTFEGPDGAGKTTALKSVAAKLEAAGHKVLVTKEPGSPYLKHKIRQVLLDGGPMTPWAEVFLFLADRTEHVSTVIRPALDSDVVVLCDRYGDSTTVYQGAGRGLDRQRLRELNLIATGGLRPDLTLLFVIDPELAAARLEKPERAEEQNRLDKEGLEFQKRVAQGFAEEAELDPQRWVKIDASLAPDQVADQVLDAIASRMA